MVSSSILHHKFHWIWLWCSPIGWHKVWPLLYFPAVAVDNCTRAPVEPAVEVCPDLNLKQTESPRDWLAGVLFDLSAQNPFYSETVGCLNNLTIQGCLVKIHTMSLIVLIIRGENLSSPATLFSFDATRLQWFKYWLNVCANGDDFMIGIKQFLFCVGLPFYFISEYA